MPSTDLDNGIITSNTFLESLNRPEISKFIKEFEDWNKIALPYMARMSIPYQSLQKSLIRMMKGKTGSKILDFGSGTGAITTGLISQENAIEEVIALDSDVNILNQVPQRLASLGYKGHLKLINSSSMVPMPFESSYIDSIISGLGGITYCGFFLNNGRIETGVNALTSCLKECHRILKPGGYLGFSSLLPNPDFYIIKRQSIISLLKELKLLSLTVGLAHTVSIENASLFLKACAQTDKIHYLSVSKWEQTLEENDFKLIDVKEGDYAGQGIVIIARS